MTRFSLPLRYIIERMKASITSAMAPPISTAM